jgi:hypothetical protein
MDATGAKVEYGLLARLTEMILCSGCLRRGRRTAVPQVISRRHRPRTLCPACSEERGRGNLAASAPRLN